MVGVAHLGGRERAPGVVGEGEEGEHPHLLGEEVVVVAAAPCLERGVGVVAVGEGCLPPCLKEGEGEEEEVVAQMQTVGEEVEEAAAAVVVT